MTSPTSSLPSSDPGTSASRREFIRHTVDVPLEVEPFDAGESRHERGYNISSGGLAFSTGVCPSRGQLLRLRIPTVDPPFEATARVAWCRPEGEGYLVGAQFTDAAAAFRSRMVQQVCSIERYRKEVATNEGRELTPQEAAAEWIGRFAGRFPGHRTVST